eukprot:gene10342-2479_t
MRTELKEDTSTNGVNQSALSKSARSSIGDRVHTPREKAKHQLKDRILKRLSTRQERTQQMKEEDKQNVHNALAEARKVPLDLLAGEWLQQNVMDLSTRLYLVENCLGTVVLVLEKLLKEADQRKVISEKFLSGQFNAVNFLAQSLMRNNPRFSNFPDASPYMQSLYRVELELRNRVYELSNDKQAQRQAEFQRRQTLVIEKQQQELVRIQDAIGTWAPSVQSLRKSHVYDVLRESDPNGQFFPQIFNRQLDTSGVVDKVDLAGLLAPLLTGLTTEQIIPFLKNINTLALETVEHQQARDNSEHGSECHNTQQPRQQHNIDQIEHQQERDSEEENTQQPRQQQNIDQIEHQQERDSEEENTQQPRQQHNIDQIEHQHNIDQIEHQQ